MEIALQIRKVRTVDSTGLASPVSDLSDVLSPRKPVQSESGQQRSAYSKTVTLILSLVLAVSVTLVAVGIPLSTLNGEQLVRDEE
jgi:hypothetical protein